jgi:S-adenosylmethionine hydrolase
VADLASALGAAADAAERGADSSALQSGAPLAVELDTAPGTQSTSAAPRSMTATWRRTFGEAATGELLLYEDSSGNLAIAVSSGNAAQSLGAGTGARIGIRRG